MKTAVLISTASPKLLCRLVTVSAKVVKHPNRNDLQLETPTLNRHKIQRIELTYLDFELVERGRRASDHRSQSREKVVKAPRNNRKMSIGRNMIRLRLRGLSIFRRFLRTLHCTRPPAPCGQQPEHGVTGSSFDRFDRVNWFPLVRDRRPPFGARRLRSVVPQISRYSTTKQLVVPRSSWQSW